MVALTRAHNELFRRTPDESFDSFDSLHQKCREDRDNSLDRWVKPQELVLTHDLTIAVADNPDLRFNDWSFSQTCRMAGVHKDTINRLSWKTASKVLEETLPFADKPVQLLSTGDQLRSIHGVGYTRLWNAELLDLVQEFASDFTPPQKAMDGTSTGLYCGEQDMFTFLIDPLGWAEIDGEAFAPGFFLWNSEVGRRTMGVQTFWFQKVCQNHIVWDAVEIVEFTRKHTANVREGLSSIRRIIEGLVAKRDSRRDGFVNVMRRAMVERLGENSDEVTKELVKHDIPKHLIRDALEIARTQGGFTIFSLVDALTRLSQQAKHAGDRAELDLRIGQLISLALVA